MENKEIYFLYKPIIIQNIGILHPNINQIPDDITLNLYYIPEYNIYVGKCKNIKSLIFIKEFLLDIISENQYEDIKLIHMDKKIKMIKYNNEFNTIANMDVEFEELTEEEIERKNNIIKYLKELISTYISNNKIFQMIQLINNKLDIIINQLEVKNQYELNEIDDNLKRIFEEVKI